MVKKTIKTRNRYALMAWNMSGAGKHKDKKKHNNKYSCRNKNSEE